VITGRAGFIGVNAGDQPVFVPDIGKIECELGWRPGVGLLLDWICQNRRDLERVVEAF